ncbi:hypothetical protein HDK90DRAFT_539501 [Phyllosticta capitalensis]|uniref:F-box domain-containing protein n=1 Tax=Phyllosticta capitalensis TaxID=121624 RepID=A0ABR1Z3T3_9PEZI
MQTQPLETINANNLADTYNDVPEIMTCSRVPNMSDDSNITELTTSLKRLSFDDERDCFALGDLPSELVWEIGKQLPMESRLALAATCKDFQSLLHTKIKDADVISRATFLQSLDRDNLTRAVEWEKSGEADSIRACAGCHHLHWIAAFSSAQLFQQPRQRKCRGREGRFRVCEHITLSWDEIMQMPLSKDPLDTEDGDEMDSDIFSCQECSTRGGEGFYGISHSWLDPSRCGLWLHKTYKVTTCQRILTIGELQSINGKVVREKLGDLRWRICPHTVTSSEHFAGLEEIEFYHLVTVLDIDELEDLQSALGKFCGNCSDPRCETIFYLGANGSGIYLWTRRDLGYLNNVNDDVWLVQCGQA